MPYHWFNKTHQQCCHSVRIVRSCSARSRCSLQAAHHRNPRAGLWDGDKGNGTTTAPGLASPVPTQQCCPCPTFPTMPEELLQLQSTANPELTLINSASLPCVSLNMLFTSRVNKIGKTTTLLSFEVTRSSPTTHLLC